MMNYLVGILLFTILLIGCKNEGNTSKITDADTTEVEKNTIDSTTEMTSANFKLIQGTWRNVDDPFSTLVFEGNTTKNFYDGMDVGKIIEFSLGNNCEDGSNPENSSENDAYISTKGSANECYYIVKLDQDSLIMSFLGRGNTLRFKREE
tara:strand:- start:129266 stop:129715 length:450 start_codon:yes stop_codon:yes gene_type:complete